MTNTTYMDRTDKNKVGIVKISDIRVIPVIFVPGVMGSNLMKKGPNEEPDENSMRESVWRFDSPATLLKWSMTTSGPARRKTLLHPDRVQVDNRGNIATSSETEMQKNKISQEYPENSSDKEAIERYIQKVTEAINYIDPEIKLFGTRRSRGWGEVAFASYGVFLEKLQHDLFYNKPSKPWQPLSVRYQQLIDIKFGLECGPDSLDQSCINTIAPYQFPVHVVGYNWLDSNMKSAQRLNEKINKIIKFYRSKKFKCNKVILVTHSMGGLVARYYSECMGGNKNIYGIVHGVMPSLGAAAAYTRMKCGTENPQSTPEGYITSHILGRNAAELVAICSQSSGPLELLPSPEYISNWLKIEDRHGDIGLYPVSNVYDDIYLKRRDWWKLIDENLLNPFNIKLDKSMIEHDWSVFSRLIINNVQEIHKSLKLKYHHNTYSFYGRSSKQKIPAKHLTQETVLWTGVLAGGHPNAYPEGSKMEDGRLDLSEVTFFRTVSDELTSEEKTWKLIEKQRAVYSWIGQRFNLRPASENGDGTVSIYSGQIFHDNIKERLAVEVAHEPAFKHELSQAFTLRSIIKIAQQVTDDEEMVFND